jgi:hypothetical protein
LGSDPSGYKNERVNDIAKRAMEKGVPKERIITLLSWLFSEKGSFSESRNTDVGGHSVGLCQCHEKYRKCVYTYEEQKEQCIDWFLGYTKNSTHGTIYSDIRKGHNIGGGTAYENRIRKHEKFFIFY